MNSNHNSWNSKRTLSQIDPEDNKDADTTNCPNDGGQIYRLEATLTQEKSSTHITAFKRRRRFLHGTNSAFTETRNNNNDGENNSKNNIDDDSMDTATTAAIDTFVDSAKVASAVMLDCYASNQKTTNQTQLKVEIEQEQPNCSKRHESQRCWMNHVFHLNQLMFPIWSYLEFPVSAFLLARVHGSWNQRLNQPSNTSYALFHRQPLIFRTLPFSWVQRIVSSYAKRPRKLEIHFDTFKHNTTDNTVLNILNQWHRLGIKQRIQEGQSGEPDDPRKVEEKELIWYDDPENSIRLQNEYVIKIRALCQSNNLQRLQLENLSWSVRYELMGDANQFLCSSIGFRDDIRIVPEGSACLRTLKLHFTQHLTFVDALQFVKTWNLFLMPTCHRHYFDYEFSGNKLLLEELEIRFDALDIQAANLDIQLNIANLDFDVDKCFSHLKKLTIVFKNSNASRKFALNLSRIPKSLEEIVCSAWVPLAAKSKAIILKENPNIKLVQL